MNQYIITSNLLDRIYDMGFSRGCMERDEEHNRKLNALYAEVESRPYQSERDKVLDEAMSRMDLLEYSRDPTIGAVVSFAEVINVLEELRQAGEQK